MVKSRAEICRDYRKRLKERDNDGYLRRERERQRRNYTPSHLLSTSARKERRRKGKEAVRRHRLKQKERAPEHENSHEEDGMDTSGYESVGSSTSNLVVAMPFPQRAGGPRMRISKQLAEANDKLSELKNKNIELARKLKSEQKKNQRLKRLQSNSSPKTPRSKAEALMNEAELSEVQKDIVRKELVFGNAVAEQIQEGVSSMDTGSMKCVRMVMAGEILKKYRCSVAFCHRSGLNKNTLAKYRIKPPKTIEEGQSYKRKFEDRIIEFFERDDNSRVQPGKGDATKCGNQVRQNRVLTDYLETLHNKYLSENPDHNVSYSTFCRIRPRYIQLSAFISRNSCLCTKHQNMALITKALRKECVLVSVNPEKFIEEELDVLSLETKIDCAEVNFSQWKRVEVEERGKRKHVMRIVQNTLRKEDFINHVAVQSEDFKSHVTRVKIQYEKIRKLKENLPQNHVILHMDFAENYSCRSHDEIQSAYFNQTGVTLHPIVVYYRIPDTSALQHRSFVVISDTQSHNSHAVLCFLDSIIPEVKMLVPGLQVCHYWTDSPTSQYRNKLIFDTVANHKDSYGCFAVWNYFEAGHGKGPCDGLGGTVKRMADTAVKSGRVVIQDAKDFFFWATSSTFTNVTFKFVSDETIQDKVSSLESTVGQLRPVKGTMKVHAVYGTGKSTALVRETSCYCQVCMSIEGPCDSWRKISTRTAIPSDISTPKSQPGGSEIKLNLVANDFVAAVYGERWYIGKVLNVDSEEGDVEISFMERKKQLFRWPSRPDTIWVDSVDILCKVQKPVETGKSKRMFKICGTEEDNINAHYNACRK